MRLSSASLVLFFFSFSLRLMAHPIPEIPVRGTFDSDGTCTIRVEVDPRCFEADWESVIYLLHIQMTKLMSAADCEELKAQARALVDADVEFFFEPTGAVKPEFTWEFTTLGGGPLVKIDDPVMVTGTWRTTLPEDATGYSVRATPANKYAVVFENTLHGKPVERTAVLFPGEKSFTLQMDGKNASAASAPPAITDEETATPKAGGTSWMIATTLLVAALAVLWLARRSRA
jgi:hypothetical protein